MASVARVRRMVNPGSHRRKRNMSLLQKLHFGSKAQRTSAAKRLKNTRKRRTAKRKNYSVRRRNVSNVVTIRRRNPKRRKRNRSRRNYGTREGRSWSNYTKSKPKSRKRNPRRRRRNSKKVVIVNKGGKMARRRRARKSNKSYRRRKMNRGRARSYRRKRNPGVTRHHRRRRYNRGRNRGRTHSRRRNPGFLSGTAGRIVGVIGGITVTRLLYGFVPSTFATGVLGYLSIGVIAFAQGKLVGKVMKNGPVGEDFLVGGFAYLVAKMLNDFFPTVGAYTGISGMGLIGGSNFYIPQVNAPGQGMGNFLVPGAVQNAIGAASMAAAPQQSLGRLRRTGRLM